MHKSEPFKHAKKMEQDIASIFAQAAGDSIMRRMLLDALPAYESRGHGRKARKMCRTNFERPVHDAPPQVQGKREIARRLRQAARV